MAQPNEFDDQKNDPAMVDCLPANNSMIEGNKKKLNKRWKNKKNSKVRQYPLSLGMDQQASQVSAPTQCIQDQDLASKKKQDRKPRNAWNSTRQKKLRSKGRKADKAKKREKRSRHATAATKQGSTTVQAMGPFADLVTSSDLTMALPQASVFVESHQTDIVEREDKGKDAEMGDVNIEGGRNTLLKSVQGSTHAVTLSFRPKV
ncbi:hypothetical protein N7508_010859 [Penicillium antarcticum]|uniref:uncharacterized protein n=1 Tax=Penicillium antarcticum TaxID=416450 RepID=UPI00238969E1|nr:uncharacterized protein N7508_010859 [Penicillium antarcticum]KAJ5296038.1 hypothetical protein N7508_010859 [Penicillium antarcticum]